MKFLVAVDGSNEPRNAHAYASEIAEATEASITLVHAVDPAAYDEGEANRFRRSRTPTSGSPSRASKTSNSED